MKSYTFVPIIHGERMITEETTITIRTKSKRTARALAKQQLDKQSIVYEDIVKI